MGACKKPVEDTEVFSRKGTCERCEEDDVDEEGAEGTPTNKEVEDKSLIPTEKGKRKERKRKGKEMRNINRKDETIKSRVMYMEIDNDE